MLEPHADVVWQSYSLSFPDSPVLQGLAVFELYFPESFVSSLVDIIDVLSTRVAYTKME